MSGGRSDLLVIGWTEYVELPEWGVKQLRAKVDTGARSSALHVENIEELPRGQVRFDIVLHRQKRKRRVRVKTRIKRRGWVRSSTGHRTRRIFVSTRLCIGPIQREIEVSLVDRERMIHRMLLGRTALTGGILINAGQRMRLGRSAGKKKKKKPTTR